MKLLKIVGRSLFAATFLGMALTFVPTEGWAKTATMQQKDGTVKGTVVDEFGEPITPYLNWSKPIPWKKPTEDEQRAIESVYITNPITGIKMLDATQMNYRYEIFNHTEAAKRRNRLDPTRRVLNTDIKPDLEAEIIISKDTAFINDDGKIITECLCFTFSKWIY